MPRLRRSDPTFRSLPLLLTVLLGFVVSPFAAAGSGAIQLTFGLVLYLLIGATSSLLTAGRLWPLTFGILVVLSTCVQVLHARFDDCLALAIAESALPAAINFLTLYIILRFILFAPGVHELDRVIGAICGYFMLVFAWARIFLTVHLLDPETAFRYSDGMSHIQHDFLYFSAVTLTTLGYGDITPASQVARMFASLEGILGTLYIAIIIASLVARVPGRRKSTEM